MRIASVAYFAERYLFDIFERQTENAPPVQCYLSRSFDSYRGVEGGDFDFAFISWTKKPNTVSYRVVKDDLVGVVGLKRRYRHIGAAQTLEELAEEKWIHFPKQQEEWTSILGPTEPGYVARDVSAYKNLVLRGAGIGVIQLDVFSPSELRLLAVARKPVSHLDVKIYVIHRKDISSSAKDYLETVLDAIAQG